MKTALTLATLGDDILRRVFEYLLCAKNVKNYDMIPGKRFHPTYEFSTGILRVNKHFHNLAMQIFLNNHFICIITETNHVAQALVDDRVWHTMSRSLSPAACQMHLDITIPAWSEEKRDTFKIIIVCLDNIEDVIQSIASTQMHKNLRLRFGFGLSYDDNFTPRMQQMLLQPFLKLHRVGLECTVYGNVDADVAARIQKSMNSRLHWGRARMWSFIETLQFKRKVADQLFLCSDFSMACMAYIQLLDFHNYAAEGYRVKWSGEPDLMEYFMRQRTTALLNLYMTFLKVDRRKLFDVDMRVLGFVRQYAKWDLEERFVGSTEEAFYHLLRGVVVISGADFLPGVEYDDFVDCCSGDFGEYVKHGQEVVRQCLKLGAKMYNWQGSMNAHQANVMWEMKNVVASAIAFSPYGVNLPAPKSSCPTVQYERFVLQQVGYTGDLLEHITQTDDWYVDLVKGKAITGFTFDHKRALESAARIKGELEAISQGEVEGMSITWGIVEEEETFREQLEVSNLRQSALEDHGYFEYLDVLSNRNPDDEPWVAQLLQ